MNSRPQTIGATEFRENFDEVFDKVNSGQSIIISHRFKKSIKLEPVESGFQDQKQLLGLKAFDAAVKRPTNLDKNKSIKQLYRESLDEKYAK